MIASAQPVIPASRTQGSGANPEPLLAGASQAQLAAQTSAAVATGRVRLLIADDHPVVRKGLVSCLAGRDNLHVVGEAADGTQVLRLARELSPDIVLMDIDMPGLDGLAATEALRKEAPHIKVLILSMHSNTDYVFRILQSGARGYVLKESPTEELVQAIKTVYAGETFFSSEVARVALNQFVLGSGTGPEANLTRRERQILIQIAKGLSNKEIALYFDIGVRTVETHRERLMNKLNIHSAAGLTKFAIAKGYISATD